MIIKMLIIITILMLIINVDEVDDEKIIFSIYLGKSEERPS